MHKGWVPDWLPANANTLKEKHTPSSGQSILQFAFPPSDKWTPPPSCARVEPAAARRPALTAAWWPKDMPPAGYVVHACNGAREFLAVDFPRGEAPRAGVHRRMFGQRTPEQGMGGHVHAAVVFEMKALRAFALGEVRIAVPRSP